jgi:hypothetical protein
MGSHISIRSLLSVFFSLLLSSCSTGVIPGRPLPSISVGLLRVLPSNPRYFSDGTGKAVYLTGSHERNNLQTLMMPGDPLGKFDFVNT